MSSFDPYLAWLDIPPEQRPVNYYRLLRLRPGETDPQTIAAAAGRVDSHLRQFAAGPYAADCARLLAEVAAARDTLLDPGRKSTYDTRMGTPPRERQVAPPPPPPGTPHSTARPGGEQPLAGPAAGRAVEQPLAGPQPPGVRPPAGGGSGQRIPSPENLPGRNDSGMPGGAGTSASAPAGGGWQGSAPSFPFVPVGPVSSPAASTPAPVARPVAIPVQPSPATPPPPPPPVPEEPETKGSWIPPHRTGRVGKAIAQAESGDLAEPRTAKAKGMKRRKRELTMAMQVTAALVIVSLTAILVLVVVIAVSM